MAITYVPGGTSEFNICVNLGFTAPTDVTTTVGDFDGGLTPNDVKVSFTAPFTNTANSYAVQRATLGATATPVNCNLNATAPTSNDASGTPSGGSFATVGSATTLSSEAGAFVDHDVTNGSYCYRIVVTDTVLGPNSYSNYAFANLAATAPPTLTVTPDFNTFVDNTVSASTPGIGQHDFVFHLTGLTGTMSFLLTNASNVTRNSDGTYGFCDVDGDRKADQGGQTVIVAVNGQATSGGVNAVANVPIPSGGVITKVGKLVVVSTPFRRSAFYPEILAQQGQVGVAAAEAMKQTPMYQLYSRIAPRPEDWPRLLGKIGEAMKQDFDFSREIAGLGATTLIVAADADIFPPAHAVEMFALLGGGQRDGGWDGSGRPKSRLAILPGLTHYTIFSAPALAATVIPFLDEPTTTR